MKKIISLLKTNWPEVFLFFCFSVFSIWLMWHTFGYKNGQIFIAAKAWSDFSANIPLVRSFSFGKNFPPEYPIFPGEKIRYHFLFYFLVGMLEKIGLPLDWALNLPSAVGFTGLLIAIYLLAKTLFKKRVVGLLAVILFLLNGSFSFLEFFKKHPISRTTPAEIISNTTFPSFGPYDGKIVSAFWNLNIYTNQRHLAAAYAIVVLLVIALLKINSRKKAPTIWSLMLLGMAVGLLPFFHKVCLLISAVILVSFFLFFPKIRRYVFTISIFSAIFVVPQIIYQVDSGGAVISYQPGYLIQSPITILKFLNYWFQNLGLSFALIPLGLIFASKTAKKIFLTAVIVFAVGYLFRFSPEAAANHKFFNLFLIIGNIFVAWLIYLIARRGILGKFISGLLIVILTISGVIDFFPVKNDARYAINDYQKNPDIAWIKNNTPPNSVFLNSSFLYHPASLAGRKIFLGWPYFAWGAGYDTSARDKVRESLLNPLALTTFCRIALSNNLHYLIFNQNEDKAEIGLRINKVFFEQNLLRVYENKDSGYIIYSIIGSCSAFYDRQR